MRFGILGSLEVLAGGRAVALSGDRQRALLALLLIHANQPLSSERLIDELWAERPPQNAAKTLQMHISRLRRALEEPAEEDADGRIVTRDHGYELRVEPERVDALRFERLFGEARNELAAGRVGCACSLLEEGLSLWRGPALAEFAYEPFAEHAIARLEDLRIGALEELIEAKLALGRHTEVVGELESLIAEHPYRERLRAQLMLALYRSERQAEALQAYQDTRRKLVEELGIEPGERLRELERAILAQDRALAFIDEHQAVRRGDIATASTAADRAHSEATRGHRRPWPLAVAPALVLIGMAVLIAATASGGGATLTKTLQSPAIATLSASTGRARAASPFAQLVTRIVASQDGVWATSYEEGNLLRIDPRRLLITETINVGHGAMGVAVAAGDVWVASSLDGALTRVDIATLAIVQRIPVGNDPTDVAAGDGAVWVSNTRDGTISRVDDHTGRATAIPVGAAPRGVAVGAGGVWVADSAANELVRLDPRTGQVRDRIQVGQAPTQVAIGRDGVWVANELDSTVSLIDPSTDAVTLTKTVAGIPSALAPTGDGVWVAASDRPTLTYVRPSGATRQAQLPSLVTALAAGANGLVIAVQGSGAIHRGGALVIITASPVGQVNPDQCCDDPGPLRGLAYDSLLTLSKLPDSAGTIVPDLATAVPRAQSGGLVYTFHLRPGIRYWTGKPVRASDFLRGLERAATSSDVFAGYLAALPGALSCPRRPRCDLSRSVITNDRAGTVTLELSRPDPELLRVLALPSTPAPPGGGITPGTGPYRVVKFVPGHLIVYERNPYFRQWSQAAQPAGYPDKVIVKSGVPPDTSITAVLSGRADYTPDQPTATQLAQIELQEPQQLHISPLPSIDAMFLDTRRAPFDDVRVRRALNLAVDRNAIVKLFGGPADATPDCQYIPATVPGHQPYCPYTSAPSQSGRWTAPDLAKAKALIAASGTRGESVTIVTQPGFPAGEPTGRYFAALLQRLGYRAHLRVLQPDQLSAALDDYRHPAQIGDFEWVADFYSPSQWLTKLLSCAAWNPPLDLNNHALFCDPQLDRLAARATALELTDPVTADHLWAQADEVATNLAPWVPTVSENAIDLISSRVMNYQLIPGFGPAVDQFWLR